MDLLISTEGEVVMTERQTTAPTNQGNVTDEERRRQEQEQAQNDQGRTSDNDSDASNTNQ